MTISKFKISNKVLSVLLCLAMLLSYLPLSSLTAFAADETPTAIYVSANGSDESGDGSRQNPYATIDKGFSATLNGGAYEIILLTDITLSDAVDANSPNYGNNAKTYKAAANVTLRSDDAQNPCTILRDCIGYATILAGKDASNLLSFTLKDIVIDGNSDKYGTVDAVYSFFKVFYTRFYMESGAVLKNHVNTDATGQGGAIHLQTGSTFVMNDGIIEYCKAYSGGGIYSPSSNITITINGGILRYNESTADATSFTNEEVNAAGGGAIFTCGVLTVNGGTFTNNKAVRGGAILCRELYNENVIQGNAVIENNTATKHGGAIHSAGDITISGGTIKNNHADGRAGGIFHSSGNGILTLNGGTVYGNTEGADKISSGVVDYRNYSQSKDALSNTGSGGYIDNYVFTMVYMSNSFKCTDTIYANRPLRITAWDLALNNSYKIEPLITSSSLLVKSNYGGTLPLGNFVVFGENEAIKPDLSKFSSTGYNLIKKDTLDRFIFYGYPLSTPSITLSAENGVLQYTITPVNAETDAISGYEIQLYKEDGTTKVGEPVSVTSLTGSLSVDYGTYKASVRAIDKKRNASGYIVTSITQYCESDWSKVSTTAVKYEKTYAVSFDSNGGSGEMDTVYVADGGKYTLPANPFTPHTGKQFKAWSVGDKEYAVGDKITVLADTTVTAVWENIPAEAPTVTAGENLTLTYKDYTDKQVSVTVTEKDGYTYSYQWYDSSKKPISGATNSTYTVPNDLTVGSYDYYCVVTAKRDDNNDTATAESKSTVTVNKATATLTAPTAKNEITYGAKLSTVGLNDGWGWANGDTVPTVENNGYLAYYTPADTDNYDWTTIDGWNETEKRVERTVPVTVKKATLTVKAKNKTITYGEAPTNDGVTYEGFVNGETETVLGGTLTYDYGYTQYGDVGEFDIIPKGLSSDNYTITFEKGTLTVKKADQNAPAVQSSNETISGKKDGVITAVNSTMEYRKEGDSTYTAISGESVTDLAAGKYYVRIKGDSNHNPSPDTEVTIAAGRKLNESSPKTGYSVLWLCLLLAASSILTAVFLKKFRKVS